MIRCVRRFALVLAVLVVASAPEAWGQTRAPKLVVVVVVDQMRPDYLERHAARFTGGLRRLLERGAVFERAAYPYLNTVTCAGHSTIGTGAFPYRHGMILNAWYDREAGASTACTDDRTVTEIGYNGVTGPGDSAKRLLAPTLADTLRERANGRVVSLSQKARSAIGLAGHGADAIVWFDERGGWVTSTAYAQAPVPFLQRFIDRNPIARDYGRTWTRTLGAGAYLRTDEAAGERPPAGWTGVFPHPLGVRGGKPDGAFYTRWARSPFADEYLARMAMAAVDGLKLGRGDRTDFLGVSFSVLDLVGHAFGPDSHEVQDAVIRLDRTLDGLLKHLDARVGRENYVLALSSDHGVANVPEQVPGSGRHTGADVREAIDGALRPIYGPPPAPRLPEGRPAGAAAARASYMAYSAYTDVYLADGVMEKLRGDERARRAVIAALEALPGIVQAFPGDDLVPAAARESADPIHRAAALNYHPGRSGDIIIVPRENWILSTSATTHGTLHPYDQRVPLIFYGPGVKAGRYAGGATPADLSETLAHLAGVAFDAPDGRVLTDGVVATSAASK